MKKLLLLFSAMLLFVASYSQTFPNVDSVKKFIDDSIRSNAQLKATTVKKALLAPVKFLPEAKDTGAVLNKVHGKLTWQRSDATLYVYDTINIPKKWRPASTVTSGGSTPTISSKNLAVKFHSANQSHINYGMFWKQNVVYGKTSVGIMVKPLGPGYWNSPGYGGSHCGLYGCVGDSINGYTLTGNFFYGVTPVSFTTTDKLRHGEWAYCEFHYDQTYITISINGVPCSIVTYSGDRYTQAVTDGVGFLGGSDHQNADAVIAGFKIIESDNSYDAVYNTVVRPPIASFSQAMVYDGTRPRNYNLLFDFRDGSLNDKSSGLNGELHNGFLANADSSITAVGGQYNLPILYNIKDTLNPYFVLDSFAYANTSAAATTPPAGVDIYDSFGKPDKHFGNTFQTSLGLGTTEVGSKVWQNSGNYGILNGNVFPISTSPGITYVPDVTTDDTIILTKPNTDFYTNQGLSYSIIFRMTDLNNYQKLSVDEYGQGFVQQYVGGVYTGHLGVISFGTNWTSAKIVVSGTSVQVFRDVVSVATQTMTANLTGTNKGFELNHPLQRIKSYEIHH